MNKPTYQVHLPVLDVKLPLPVDIARAGVPTVIYLERHHRDIGVQVVLHVGAGIPHLCHSVAT